MASSLTILIVGGYGTFGGRIVELLENEPRLTLIVAGRSREKAARYCDARIHATARLVPAVFDRDGSPAEELSALQPDIAVDASGPFQVYGDAPYRLVEACIARRVHYLDLADGAEFVQGIGKFDAEARGAGVYVLSGVSSFPVLTAAVVRHLSADLCRVDTITGGIAPSPFAGVGVNVIKAIASYAGQSTDLRRGGRAVTGHPFTEQRRFTISPPGHLPLHNTLFSLVEVPDLQVLAELWPQASDIWMGAGPVPEILHRALIALAWLVRLRFIRSLLPLAPLMHVASNRMAWGEHRGGMFVEVRGADTAHGPVVRSWHLLAEGDDGPLIPSMAVEALVRNALDGRPPPAGARAATGDLELSDYERLFARRTIYTGERSSCPDATPLYPRLVGSSWQTLPPEVQAMHTPTVGTALGRAMVERGTNPIARWVAGLIGFPEPTTDVAVAVRFDVFPSGEIWTRTFGEKSFSSRQFQGRGKSEGLLCESFGPLTFAMALVPRDGRLILVLRCWSAFGIPLPMWACPRSNSYEFVEDGRFRFHVEIKHPLVGLIVRYRGWLAP